MTAPATRRFLEAAQDVGLRQITEPLAKMLSVDADRIAGFTLITGETIFTTDGTGRMVEVGPDWILIRTGHGESERTLYIAIASIVTVTLR